MTYSIPIENVHCMALLQTIATAFAKLLQIIIRTTYGTVSAKIAPRLKCYKNASRLNRYNFPTDNAIDFLFSALHSEMV